MIIWATHGKVGKFEYMNRMRPADFDGRQGAFRFYGFLHIG